MRMVSVPGDAQSISLAWHRSAETAVISLGTIAGGTHVDAVMIRVCHSLRDIYLIVTKRCLTIHVSL
jgi:hypothetical protein